MYIMNQFPFDVQQLINICRENDIAMVGLFGSMARGENTDQSDIDLLVRFAKRKSLLTVVALEHQLATILGRKVELLTESSISPYLREGIMNDLQVLYET